MNQPGDPGMGGIDGQQGGGRRRHGDDVEPADLPRRHVWSHGRQCGRDQHDIAPDQAPVQVLTHGGHETTAVNLAAPPTNRERLLRYAGTHTLGDAIHFEYWGRGIDGIGCVLIDEKQTSQIVPIDHFLHTTLPEELERIEFLDFGPQGLMLRIYTREFMQEMFDLNLELRTPVMVGGICR